MTTTSLPDRDPDPLHDLDAERAVLGAILHPSADAFGDVAAEIGESDFFRAEHQTIWRACAAVRARGAAVDLVTVCAEIGGAVANVGGPAYVASLTDGVPVSTNAAHYARIVGALAVRRLVTQAAGTMDPAALRAEIDRLRDLETGPGELAAAITTAADAITLPAPARVIWCDAAPPADAAVCSVGEPAILAAPGGSGKSYMALALALAAVANDAPARACGLTVRRGPVLVLSYEDGLARIGPRLAAIMAREDAPANIDLAAISIVTDPAPLWRPADDRGAGAVPTAALEAVRARALADSSSLIVIDPVSAAVGGVNLNEGGAARACVRTLAALSTDTGAGCLVIAHDTKASRAEVRAGGAPGAGAVAGSGQWFDAARGALYLGRSPDGARLLECLKANHGRAGWARLLGEVVTDAGAFRGFRAEGPAIPNADAWRRQKSKAGNGPGSGDLAV